MATVAELIEALKHYPSNHVVMMASDGEGNDYHEWYDISVGLYIEDRDSTDSFASWTYDDEEDETTEREVTLDESNSICLWPVG